MIDHKKNQVINNKTKGCKDNIKDKIRIIYI